MKKRPGVADNKSYKDQYHFTDILNPRGSELKSLDLDPPINTTIKENPYRSNVEIEGGEVVLQPDMSALFKAMGKKHSRGGMDVLLKPDAFIFSDDKTLSLSDKEKKLFELKSGGKYSATKSTPAQVVKKNIPMKHYNTLINNIQDVNKDDIAKKSSSMMLEKYIEMLGNIAYVQEAKKDFPDGLPAFSVGTAPVFNKNVKANIAESKQFAKYGGRVNPYKATGGFSPDKCACGKDAQGNCIPCTDAQLQELLKKAGKATLADVKGMNKIGSIENTDIYHAGTDPRTGMRTTPGPKMSDQDWINFLKNESPAHKAGRLAKYRVPGSDKLLAVSNPVAPPMPGYNPPPEPPSTTETTTQIPNIEPNPTTGNSQDAIRADWEFTPYQKRSQAYAWLQFANVKRYMPFRSRYNATYAEPSLLNPEQAIGDVQAAANQQTGSLNTLNPILRNAQAQDIYGKLLNTTPGIRSQYDNQNAQITNQFRMYNNQIKNDETLKNLGFDQQYYQQAVEGRKNFENFRTAAANNAMNLRDSHVQENQQLAYNLLTLNNPAYGYDWRTGSFTRNKMDIRDVERNPQADVVGNLLSTLLDTNRFSTLDPRVQSAVIRAATLKGLPLPQGYGSTPPPFPGGKKGGKAGGRKTKNPYRY